MLTNTSSLYLSVLYVHVAVSKGVSISILEPSRLIVHVTLVTQQQEGCDLLSGPDLLFITA